MSEYGLKVLCIAGQPTKKPAYPLFGILRQLQLDAIQFIVQSKKEVDSYTSSSCKFIVPAASLQYRSLLPLLCNGPYNFLVERSVCVFLFRLPSSKCLLHEILRIYGIIRGTARKPT